MHYLNAVIFINERWDGTKHLNFFFILYGLKNHREDETWTRNASEVDGGVDLGCLALNVHIRLYLILNSR